MPPKIIAGLKKDRKVTAYDIENNYIYIWFLCKYSLTYFSLWYYVSMVVCIIFLKCVGGKSLFPVKTKFHNVRLYINTL